MIASGIIHGILFITLVEQIAGQNAVTVVFLSL